MKKIIAINGSPRKKNNTATMLQHALEGAKSVGAEVEMINLYDLNFKGCTSCFACKRKESKNIGKCAMKDELTPVLNKLMVSDAVVVGSPIYLSNITGETQSFLERFIFMNLSYDKESLTNYTGRKNIGFVYTMGVTDDMIPLCGLDSTFESYKGIAGRIFNGKSDYVTSSDAYQFKDYSKFATGMINLPQKEKVRKEQFPIDCQKAFDLGKSLVE